jgi:Cu-processing system permease protein
LLKSWFVIGYVLLLSVAGWGIFTIESYPQKALLTLMELTILAVPLLCMIFSTIYYYNSLEFILLLLTQPVKRNTVIKAFFISISVTLLLCYLVGVGLPLLVHYWSVESLILLLSGSLLTLIFTALALFICTLNNDKARGMGFTLLIWAFFAFIYDGLLLYLMYQFSDYPIEQGVLILSFFNPVDIGRILVVMQTEASALLGYSGAIFRNFFGGRYGFFISSLALLIWMLVPFIGAQFFFLRKDL